jgi:cytochrome c oxidase assembly protein subunit 11
MVGAAYAAVPLYRAFCQATGFDGTTRRGTGEGIGKPIDRILTVRFDTNVRDLPWSFKPEQVSEKVQIGAPAQAWFKIRNDGDVPLTGRALYNVVPESAAAYFVKTQCFCFTDQTIPAHTEMRFPVIYYVEPGFAADRNTEVFQEITLSYTFFPVHKDEPATTAPAPVGDTAALKPSQGLGGSQGRGL